MTRETERGTIEALLAMPIMPGAKIMLGKIIPYVAIGFLQATMIVTAGHLLFKVPIVGISCAACHADDAVHRH